jgi:hypothetical protein
VDVSTSSNRMEVQMDREGVLDRTELDSLAATFRSGSVTAR